jgi:hypothetical protein
MKRKTVKMIAFALFVPALALGPARHAQAQDGKTPYPSMAPLEQYLIADRNAEIALARTAAPPSISGDATVMVLGSRREERFCLPRRTRVEWLIREGPRILES